MRTVIEDRVDSKTGEVVGRRVRQFCESPSRTKQSMRDECDVNGIMSRYERTGVITHLAKRDAYFADVSEVPDFATAIRVVGEAEKMFSTLPAKVRKEFDNDPSQYVAFCADPLNLPRMRELGIANPLPQPVLVPGQVQPAAAPPPAPVPAAVKV